MAYMAMCYEPLGFQRFPSDVAQSRYSLILHGLPILGRLILLVLLRRSALDERCFLLKVLTKFAAVPGIPEKDAGWFW